MKVLSPQEHELSVGCGARQLWSIAVILCKQKEQFLAFWSANNNLWSCLQIASLTDNGFVDLLL